MFIKLTKISPQGAFPTLNVNPRSIAAVEPEIGEVWNNSRLDYDDEVIGTMVHILGGGGWLVSESQDQVIKLIEEAL